MTGFPTRLIFVHIPKSAGTSLMKSIAERVGDDDMHCILDKVGAKGYLHRNLEATAHAIRCKPFGYRVYFGHFMAIKYARCNGRGFARREGCCYATMLRDPLQRAMSHYHFWKRTDVSGHRIWERFIKENWSLERFLLSDELCNLQSRFFWGFPLRRFDMVGLAERYEESLTMLGRIFPPLSNLPSLTANVNPVRPDDGTYNIDLRLVDAFKQRNQLDYALYSTAVTMFEQQRRLLVNKPVNT